MPAPKDYRLTLSAQLMPGGELQWMIYNANPFRVYDLELTVHTPEGVKREKIGSIEAKGEWRTGQKSQSYAPFVLAAYFEGAPQHVDPALFDAENGVYRGNPHHALVWPQTELERIGVIRGECPEKNAAAELHFPMRGPRIAISGHSFTGLWDSSYEYLAQMARKAGWNAQIAYSYWGGTGLAHHAGLVPGCEPRAAQTDAMLAANEVYDFYIAAGNSDEAISTSSGQVGAKDYTQRESMLRGAQIMHEKAKRKGAQTLLWATHAYQYGFFRNMDVKPWREGKPGESYERDGKTYTLTLTRREMMEEIEAYYAYLAEQLGENTRIAPVGRAYFEAYAQGIQPYAHPGQECGDCGHQNNRGNLIAASVLYALIFGESPEGLGAPVSHTWGMDGGPVAQEEAERIHRIAWEVVKKE